jgi:hypothetical protein
LVCRQSIDASPAANVNVGARRDRPAQYCRDTYLTANDFSVAGMTPKIG